MIKHRGLWLRNTTAGLPTVSIELLHIRPEVEACKDENSVRAV